MATSSRITLIVACHLKLFSSTWQRVPVTSTVTTFQSINPKCCHVNKEKHRNGRKMGFLSSITKVYLIKWPLNLCLCLFILVVLSLFHSNLANVLMLMWGWSIDGKMLHSIFGPWGGDEFHCLHSEYTISEQKFCINGYAYFIFHFFSIYLGFKELLKLREMCLFAILCRIKCQFHMCASCTETLSLRCVCIT